MVDLDTDERNSGSIAVSAERLFVTTHNKRAWNASAPPDGRLETFAFSASGQLSRLASLSLDEGTYFGALYARGARAFTSSSGRLSVVDTSGPSGPTLRHYDMQGWGCSSLEVHADRAYCALGQYGVYALDL